MNKVILYEVVVACKNIVFCSLSSYATFSQCAIKINILIYFLNIAPWHKALDRIFSGRLQERNVESIFNNPSFSTFKTTKPQNRRRCSSVLYSLQHATNIIPKLLWVQENISIKEKATLSRQDINKQTLRHHLIVFYWRSKVFL